MKTKWVKRVKWIRAIHIGKQPINVVHDIVFRDVMTLLVCCNSNKPIDTDGIIKRYFGLRVRRYRRQYEYIFRMEDIYEAIDEVGYLYVRNRISKGTQYRYIREIEEQDLVRQYIRMIKSHI